MVLDVMHTVGPIGENPKLLSDCYNNCLTLASQHGIRTIVSDVLLVIQINTVNTIASLLII